jgi:hypothetical protein
MNRGCTGVGDLGYSRVTGFLKPWIVEARVNIIPFTLFSIFQSPRFG